MLNWSHEQCWPIVGAMTTARALKSDRASSTREAILTAAERLFAEHGVYAVSNRQVSEAAGQGNNEDPAFSPDGRYVVFSSSRVGRPALFLADTTGAHQVQLTRSGGDDTSPSWSLRLP